MKIAVITTSYPRYPGDGTAPFVKSICEHLARLGHKIEVLAPYDPAIRPTVGGEVIIHRFRYIWPERMHIMGYARSLQNDKTLRPMTFLILPFFLFFAFINLMRITGRQGSEAIHAHWVLPNGLVAAWVSMFRRIPFIISLHGSDMYVANRNFLFRWVARWIFQRASAVTACSLELQQAALGLGSPIQTRLLTWGADPELFRPNRRSPEHRKVKFGSDQSLVIGALGRLVAKKGFDRLIQAMPGVLSVRPDALLVIGGDGELMDNLQNQVRNLNIAQSVQFLGTIAWDEVPDFLANLDIFVLPSIRDESGNVDGLPTVLLEAMSSGDAVIASDIGGVNLVIENDKNGILVDSGEVTALSDALLGLAQDEENRRRLSRAARQSVLLKFKWKNIVKEIALLLETAAWKAAKNLRLGLLYRAEMLQHIKNKTSAVRILDIGCHDGYFLSTQNAPLRVGVDLVPVSDAPPGVTLISADACFLPFSTGAFDQVYALDVIEHVKDDSAFAASISRVVSPRGRFILTTPSVDIRLNPFFLTQWISRQWGHYLRMGYTTEQLSHLFNNFQKVNYSYWNAPGFRFWYLPLRLLSTKLPSFTKSIIRKLANYDSRHTKGWNGFIIIEANK